MTTATAAPVAVRQRGNPPASAPRPSMLRLAQVEFRKSYDTRAGFWLLVVIGLVAAAVVTILLFTVDDSDLTFATFFLGTQLPVGLLLPVVGILLVTSEWSQRSAMTTFALVPERHRVIAAKFAAGVMLTLLAVAASLAAAALGNLAALGLGGADGSWTLEASALGEVVVFQLVNMLVGLAFGLALLSSPLAIVLYFLLPTVFSILTTLISALREPAQWLDLSVTTMPLLGDAMSATAMDGQAWARLGTSLLLWLALPLVIGLARVRRREVQ